MCVQDIICADKSSQGKHYTSRTRNKDQRRAALNLGPCYNIDVLVLHYRTVSLPNWKLHYRYGYYELKSCLG